VCKAFFLPRIIFFKLKLKLLLQEVDRLASSFGSDDYVGAVLGGLPKEVTSSGGIPTEAAIRDRY
jgi:hypothetical protein